MSTGWVTGAAVVAVVAVAARIGLATWRAMQEDGGEPGDNPLQPPLQPRIDGDPGDYVFVEDDGSARDLSADELGYLGTSFDPGDGARPYIKWKGYAQLTPDGRIGGFLRRDRLPDGMPVAPTPGADG